MSLTRHQIAQRAAKEIKDGFYVNLGIGIPTLAANYIPSETEVMLQSENGLLGMGRYPTHEEVDADLINAGKETVTANTGASFFGSDESFAMIRGRHIDLTILGAMEVDQNGDIASWMVPGKMVKGMGGAMDLVASARDILVTMTHTDNTGKPKLVSKCTLPLTGTSCIKRVLTDLGLFSIQDGVFQLVEIAPGVEVEQVQALTEGDLIIPDCVPIMTI